MPGKNILITVLTAVAVCLSQSVSISGRVTNTVGTAIPGALVELENLGQTTISDLNGYFLLSSGTYITRKRNNPEFATIHNGLLYINVAERSVVSITSFLLDGKALSTVRKVFSAGTHSITLPQSGAGIFFYKVKSGGTEVVLKGFSMGGISQGRDYVTKIYATRSQPLAKEGAKPMASPASFNDVLTVTATGYLDYQMSITNPDTIGIEIQMLKKVYGTFVVRLHAPYGTLPGYTVVLGGIYDNPIPVAIIWEEVAASDDCRLLTPRIPLCEVPCGETALCVEDDSCQSCLPRRWWRRDGRALH